MANPVYRSKLFEELANPSIMNDPLAEECMGEAFNNFASTLGIEPTAACIADALEAIPAWKAQSQLEFHLCDVLGRKHIAKLVDSFKTQFEKTGIITPKEMDEACIRVDKIFSGNGKFSRVPNAKELLLPKTLLQIEQIPIEQRDTKQLVASWTKSCLFGKSQATLLAESKAQTLVHLKQSMQIPMVSTAPRSGEGENDNWDKSVKLNFEPLSTAPHAPSKSIYPWRIEMTPVVTDPGSGFHFRYSYINLAFSDLFKQGLSEKQIWDSLPLIAQRDALRHCLYLESCPGTAEEIACSLFGNKDTDKLVKGEDTDELEMQLRLAGLSLNSFKNPELSDQFVSQGEKLLELYYFNSYPPGDSCSDFSAKFNTLPPEPLFLQCFSEMAVAAGVQIEPSNYYYYAQNNWKQIDMIHLSVQALERCLHTKRG